MQRRPPPEEEWEGCPNDPVLVALARDAGLRALDAHPRGDRGATHGTARVARAPAGVAVVPVNTGRPLALEGPGFSGHAVLWVRGVPSADGVAEMPFAGKKRRSVMVVQGRFKSPTPVNDAVTGHSFDRPAKRLPPKWFVRKLLLSVAHVLTPSALVGDPFVRPYMLMPLLASCQAVHCALPGSEPSISGPPVEDMRAFSAEFSDRRGEPMSAGKRRAFFSKTQNGARFVHGTEHVWTFWIWQHLVDLSTYKLHFGMTHDLASHLDGQPLQFMARDMGAGCALWDFEIWHRKLLKDAHAAAAEAAT